MKCSLCGLEFDEKDAQRACSGCVMGKTCNLVKCPNCGYESPVESKLIKKLREWGNKKK